ncbi:MAG: metalloregulator ArsR/SmtB family transcription factor [Candidatus Cloacimonetes bacterium]|jgi:ArsR family transcriptional regulator|nr:metalloregulator ArsR/SmtB family transcription factor [Candidatus Cloacimonadota bacterium]MDN5356985.1 ArsR family transcriptional regulator, lead/cadmium/zinc/bismuth-responsive transcriptional [Candidatus Methanomethylophilaceae archaeon]MDY0368130.1 metalloregulator ArsR/SmtB family transcription factor [Candidatus Syntrophosphaera sp.]MEA4978007.1 metalloregulator ArsR/SmtB family transcription factor [Methanomassiliicoccaceae archaeon]
MENYDRDICDVHVTHQDVVELVRKSIPKEEDVFRLSEFFSLFGDSTRVKILMALEVSEMCVCDIGASLMMSDSAVSHQLKALKRSRLIKSRRDGKFVYYSLCDDHVKSIIDFASEHLGEEK